MPVRASLDKFIGLAEMEARFRRTAGAMNAEVLKGLANVVADASPVDTGTYVMAHAVYEGTDLGSIPAVYISLGRPGGQDADMYRGLGRDRLHRQIDALETDEPNFIMGNESEHRRDVERRWYYEVFSQAAAAGPGIVQAAAAKLGLVPKG
jgi:hypothetical protein